MGINSFAFHSKYAHWFAIPDWDKKSPLSFPFTYEGWHSVQELPVLRKDAHGIVQGPKEYIFAATHRWMALMAMAILPMALTSGVSMWPFV